MKTRDSERAREIRNSTINSFYMQKSFTQQGPRGPSVCFACDAILFWSVLLFHSPSHSHAFSLFFVHVFYLTTIQICYTVFKWASAFSLCVHSFNWNRCFIIIVGVVVVARNCYIMIFILIKSFPLMSLFSSLSFFFLHLNSQFYTNQLKMCSFFFCEENQNKQNMKLWQLNKQCIENQTKRNE